MNEWNGAMDWLVVWMTGLRTAQHVNGGMRCGMRGESTHYSYKILYKGEQNEGVVCMLSCAVVNIYVCITLFDGKTSGRTTDIYFKLYSITICLYTFNILSVCYIS